MTERLPGEEGFGPTLSTMSSWAWPLRESIVGRWTRLFAGSDDQDASNDTVAFPWISTSVHALCISGAGCA